MRMVYKFVLFIENKQFFHVKTCHLYFTMIHYTVCEYIPINRNFSLLFENDSIVCLVQNTHSWMENITTMPQGLIYLLGSIFKLAPFLNRAAPFSSNLFLLCFQMELLHFRATISKPE